MAGVGQEHRLGRWARSKVGSNGIYLIPLCPDKKSTEEDQDQDVAEEDEDDI